MLVVIKVLKLIFLFFIFYFVLTAYRAINIANSHYYEFDRSRLGILHTYPIKRENDNLRQLEIFKHVDENGVMLSNYDNINNLSGLKGKQYNPVNNGFVLVHELSEIDSVDEQVERIDFIKSNLAWFIQSQTDTGLWPVNFDHKMSGRKLNAPWASGLAQAFGISSLVQGYALFHDPRYKNSAIRGAHIMLESIEKGGVTSTSEYGQIIEEYPFPQKNIHVLNGYMYAIISLAQIAQIAPEFNEALIAHLDNLNNIIYQFHLLGDWSAYSLDKPNLRNHANYANPKYHQIHMAQLDYLCFISGKKNICQSAKDFKQYKHSFAAYIVYFSYVVFKDVLKIAHGF